MYGEIPAAEIETKSPLIEENGIYVISRFRVSNAKRSFRPVASQFMVEFTFRTQVSAAREDMSAFPAYAYRLTPIDNLKSRAGDTTDFVGESFKRISPVSLF
jgi:replication factor A1